MPTFYYLMTTIVVFRDNFFDFHKCIVGEFVGLYFAQRRRSRRRELSSRVSSTAATGRRRRNTRWGGSGTAATFGEHGCTKESEREIEIGTRGLLTSTRRASVRSRRRGAGDAAGREMCGGYGGACCG